MSGRPKEFEPKRAIRAATQAFWKSGYEATGMDRLLKEMGVSRQSAYDTFGGKRQIFLLAFQEYLTRVQEQIGGLLADPSRPTRLRVIAFLDEVIRRTCPGDGRGCMLTNSIVELAPHDPEVKSMAAGTLTKLEELLARLLEEARLLNDLPPGIDPRGFARLIVVAFEGALVLTKADRGESVRGAVGVLKGMLDQRP